MATLTSELRMTKLPATEWRQWRIDEPLTFQGVTVPAGFISDGASVPRPLWWFLPQWGRYSSAAIVHDYLCRSLDEGIALGLTRRDADRIFYDGMIECGVNITIRWLMWVSVRLYAIIARK